MTINHSLSATSASSSNSSTPLTPQKSSVRVSGGVGASSPSSSKHIPHYEYLDSPTVQVILVIHMVVSLYYSLSLSRSSPVVSDFFTLTFWTIFYLLLQLTFEKIFGTREVEGFSRGSYFVAIVHQGILCPLFVVILLLSLPSFHSSHVFEYFYSSWHEAEYFVERHVFLSIIGYELKDFLYAHIDMMFIIHHTMAFFGCFLCLNQTAGVGLTALNGLVAEIGSFSYNFFCLHKPSYPALLFYFIVMSTSNFMGAIVSVFYIFIEKLPAPYKLIFMLLTIALVFARQGRVFKEWKIAKNTEHNEHEKKID